MQETNQDQDQDQDQYQANMLRPSFNQDKRDVQRMDVMDVLRQDFRRKRDDSGERNVPHPTPPMAPPSPPFAANITAANPPNTVHTTTGVAWYQTPMTQRIRAVVLTPLFLGLVVAIVVLIILACSRPTFCTLEPVKEGDARPLHTKTMLIVAAVAGAIVAILPYAYRFAVGK
jgi:hypothetical protein